MPSLLKIAVEGDIEKYMADEVALKRKADIYALDVASQTLGTRLGRQTGAKLGERMARTWKARVYKNPINPRALVYSKAPAIISSFMADTIILPKKGKHLAIPTGFNRVSGRKGAKVRVTPKEMVASGLSFTRKRNKGPGLIWFLRITVAETRAGWRSRKGKQLAGRIRKIAYAGGLVKVGRAGRATRDILAARAVPMFILVPQVRQKKRLDLEAEVTRIQNELPGFLEEGYNAYSGRSA